MSPASIVLVREIGDEKQPRSHFQEILQSILCLCTNKEHDALDRMPPLNSGCLTGIRRRLREHDCERLYVVGELADAENAPDLGEERCPLFQIEESRAPVNAERSHVPQCTHGTRRDESEGGDSTDDDR
jgi:hypothetical protein